ncbi:hypothetical protein G4G28_06620 [Massilia sp. Dwa41.01b]|uniref:hypothetical protein n=1 Tax=Massilia sp. Dwa41.01b TaxID=2709302 RepID=UPI0015FED245|nr:hypothetical protein [Massilia sp. Dwa41.01b]QNA88257.1 hypothetical protein G4G28_06620 [Massilia sp. Dwa41.01b]
MAGEFVLAAVGVAQGFLGAQAFAEVEQGHDRGQLSPAVADGRRRTDDHAPQVWQVEGFDFDQGVRARLAAQGLGQRPFAGRERPVWRRTIGPPAFPLGEVERHRLAQGTARPQRIVRGIRFERGAVGIGHHDADRRRLEHGMQARMLGFGLARRIERFAPAQEQGFLGALLLGHLDRHVLDA